VRQFVQIVLSRIGSAQIGEQSLSLADHEIHLSVHLFVLLMGFMPDHVSLWEWSHEETWL